MGGRRGKGRGVLRHHADIPRLRSRCGLERLPHFPGGRKAVVASSGERSMHDGAHRGRDVRAKTLERRRVGGDLRGDDGRQGVAIVRYASRERLVQDDPHGEQIGARVEVLGRKPSEALLS